MSTPLNHENIWLEKRKCNEAERQYYEMLAKLLMKNGITYDCQETPASNVANIQIENPLILSVTSKPAPMFEQKKTSQSACVPSEKKTTANASPPVENDGPEPIIALIKEVAIVTANSQPPQPQSIEKRFKPKEAKEKRNKADKKGRDKKIVNKDDKGSSNTPNKTSLAGEVAKARQHIKNSLECMDGIAALATNVNVEVVNRLNNLEKKNTGLMKVVNDMQTIINKLETRVKSLESVCCGPAKVVCAATVVKPVAVEAEAGGDGDDVDLFGSESEEESEEAMKVKEARLAAYAAKKSKKPIIIAKSNIILDVKPWDDETDMKAMETAVRAVGTDGLLWGASKLVPLAYGIHKLQISCVVEDDKVSIDWLQETLEGIEDYVQSVDIAAFNKV